MFDGMISNAPIAARDVIVVGGSAGSLPVLREVLGALPADLPAAVLIVVHQTQTTPGLLPQTLGGHSAIRADYARDGEVAEHGRAYLAPPDQHLFVEADPAHSSAPRLRLSRGPK